MDGESVTPGVSKRVLLVDDDPLGLKLAALRLKHAGFAIETASTGEEALRMATSTPPDGIVSDVRMPGMDGSELCQLIRRDPRLARVPFLLLSSAVLEEADRNAALNLGVDAIFVRTSDLRDAIDALATAFRDAE
jgi:CheY-like chemotaxis protein